MDVTQRTLVEDLHRRLDGRAWLAEDQDAYRDGVEDALREVVVVLEQQEALVPARGDGTAVSSRVS